MLRVIREQEPPKPSTKLSTADGLPTLAANRGTEPAKLTRLVRGELDWIVMKALEKDRNRRYETANGFAVDLQRYLADEPVLACPPSAGYRLRKFARRNRSGLAVAGLVLFFLVLLGSMAGWAWRDRVARAAERANHLDQAIERAELLHREGKRGEALAALERTRLLAREAEPASAVAQRIDSLQQRLDAEGRDEVFVAQFEAIRREVQTEVDVEKSVFDQEKGYPRLRAALEQYGIAIGVTPPAAAVSHIQQRPPAIQTVVVVALDECLRFVPREDSDTRQWLFDVLLAADSDPWRNQVRRAWTQPETLEALVRDIDVRQQPPSFLVLVAMGLPIESPSRWNLLRSVQFAYPGDFWANLQLGWDLNRAREARGGDSLLHGGAGLRPDNPGVLVNRGRCPAAGGRVGGSRRRSSAPSRFARYATAHRGLGAGYRESWTKPLEHYQEAIRLQPDKPAYQSLRSPQGHEARRRGGHRLLPQGHRTRPEIRHRPRRSGPLPSVGTGSWTTRSTPTARPSNSTRRMPRRHCDLGSALGLRGKLDEAIATYQEAIRVEPDNAYPHHAFGVFPPRHQARLRGGDRLLPQGPRTRPEQRLHPLATSAIRCVG